MARIVTKADFVAKAVGRGASKQDAEQRWKQRLASMRTQGAPQRPIGGKRVKEYVQKIERNKLSVGASRVVKMMVEQSDPGIRVSPVIGGAPTGLFKVTQVFTPPTTNDSDNDGRFAAIFTPRLGIPDPIPSGYSSVDCYANYIVDGQSAYPSTNWRQTGNYLSGTNLGSSVRTVDDAGVLTRYEESRGEVTGSAAGGTLAMPFGTAPTTSEIEPPAFKPRMSNDGTNSKLYLPVGTWSLVFDITGTTMTGGTFTTGGSATKKNAVVVASGTKLLATMELSIEDESTDHLIILCAGASISAVTLPLLYINSFRKNTITNTGSVRTIRPVAMQVLATSTAVNLDNGGNIAIALLPQEALQSQAITDNPPQSPGSPFLWENLSRYNLPYANMTGPFREGAFAWWMPSDVLNAEFVKPTDQCLGDYPTICVSGRYQVSGGGAVGTQYPLRIVVTRLFEYTTDNQAFSTKIPSIRYHDYEEALEFLSHQPKVSGNSSHNKLLKDIGKALHTAALTAKQAEEDWFPLIQAAKVFTGGMMF